MAPALIAGRQPLVHNHLGSLDADDARAEGNDVGVVVLFGKAGGVRLAAHAGADAMHLVCSQRNAHACAADEHAAVHCPVCHKPGHAVAANGVVEALGAVGADVQHLDSLFLQICLYFPFHLHGYMVVPDCKLHEKTS